MNYLPLKGFFSTVVLLKPICLRTSDSVLFIGKHSFDKTFIQKVGNGKKELSS